MVRRSGIEEAEHQIQKMERRCGVRNSPPDGAEVRCAEHQIRVRCPALGFVWCDLKIMRLILARLRFVVSLGMFGVLT